MSAVIDLTIGSTSESESENESYNESIVLDLPIVVHVNALIVPLYILGTWFGQPVPYRQRRISPSGPYYNPGAQENLLAVEQLRANRIAANDHNGPLPGPLLVNLTFLFSANNQMQCGEPYTRTPDVDNLAKFMLDAMASADDFHSRNVNVFKCCQKQHSCHSCDGRLYRTLRSLSWTVFKERIRSRYTDE